MSVESLEARIQRLEDIEAIRQLKGKFAYYADIKDLDGFMSLVADDAIWAFGAWGNYEGKDAIREFSKDVTLVTYSFMLHHFYNLYLEVNGDTASGRWYFLVPSTNSTTQNAEWLAGIYDEEYVRVNGAWKFKKVTTDFKVVAPYELGWAKHPVQTR
jgi:ketosteroid isomerase-like protein